MKPTLIRHHMLWVHFSKPSKIGIYNICGFILFHGQKHVHTSEETHLNLNYLVEDYPRLLLFLSFPVTHCLASLAIPHLIQESWWHANQ